MTDVATTTVPTFYSTQLQVFLCSDTSHEDELLPLVLKYDMVKMDLLAQITLRVIAAGNAGLEALIVKNAAGRNELGRLFMNALECHHFKQCGASAIVKLHSHFVDHGLDATTALLTSRPTFAVSHGGLAMIMFQRTVDGKQLIAWDLERIFLACATDQWPRNLNLLNAPFFNSESYLLSAVTLAALQSPNATDNLRSIPATSLARAYIACTYQFAVRKERDAQSSSAARRAIAHLSSLLKEHSLDQPLISAAYLSDRIISEIPTFRQALTDVLSQLWPADKSATTLDPDLDDARFIAIHVAAFELAFVKSCVCWDGHVSPWVWHWFSQAELDRLLVSAPGVCASLSRMASADRDETQVVGELVWMIGRVKNKMRKVPVFVGTVRMLVLKYQSLADALRTSRGCGRAGGE